MPQSHTLAYFRKLVCPSFAVLRNWVFLSSCHNLMSFGGLLDIQNILSWEGATRITLGSDRTSPELSGQCGYVLCQAVSRLPPSPDAPTVLHRSKRAGSKRGSHVLCALQVLPNSIPVCLVVGLGENIISHDAVWCCWWLLWVMRSHFCLVLNCSK